MSLLSFSIFEKIVPDLRPSLFPLTQKVLQADGKPLDVKGRASFTIEVDDFSCQHEFWVADIGNQGILGLDFLQINQCTLDVCTNRLKIGTRVVSCRPEEDEDFCFRVCSKETVSISASNESILIGQVRAEDSSTLAMKECLVEGSGSS